MEFITKSEEETKNILLDILNINPLENKALIFVLEGELGAGKTTFTKGLEDVLKIKIKSPTFNIVKKYEIDYKGFKNFYHLDFYRVDNIKGLDFEDIILNKENLIFIEWGSKVIESIPDFAKWIYFSYLDKDKRKILYESN
ncbi:MAG: tRNA (adenosine(37)-N6)-threonylcarbamoyltransferase complex ATPase subunit type 1 TsaE [Candidatus Pacebacteria bacterium]|nr:tRNA (adenosine(37)-N6)-threonylcarbamoyltransferase complex ATPase subunit type 1 TsaE [Candidatus Paceibacterota bacterium]